MDTSRPVHADDQIKRIAELEAMAARMEEQIDSAEKTIKESRQHLATLRAHIKNILAADESAP